MSALVDLQTAAGVSASRIQDTILSVDPNTLVVAKDISNVKDAARHRALASRSVTEALFHQLRHHEFFHKWTTHPKMHELKHLFWANSAMTFLSRQHCDVVIADCTYKTNQYKLPLITMTGCNTVLPVAQCWLPGEKKEDYLWAFNVATYD